MFRLSDFSRNNKGIVFNIVLALFMLIVAPYYVVLIKHIRDYGETNAFIAFSLFFLTIAEPFALFFKINSIYAIEHVNRSLFGRFMLVWLSHFVVSVLTVELISKAMPLQFEWLNSPIFIFTIIKELLFMFFILFRADEQPNKDGTPPARPKPVTEKKILISDIILAIYGFMVYGAVWQSMSATELLSGTVSEAAESVWFRIITYTLVFLIVYYSVRLTHFIDEWLNMRTPQQKNYYRLSLLATICTSILPLFMGPGIPSSAEINAKDPQGKTVLIQSIEYEPINYLEKLIQSGAKTNIQDSAGKTALHYAAKAGRASGIELLMKHGADPNIKDHDGGTALALASGFQKHDAMEMLLKYHADPNIAYDDGETPLMLAAEQGFAPENISLLLDHGADANKQDVNGWNALMRFSHFHNLQAEHDKQIFNLLLKHTDLNKRDKKGHTIVWHATKYHDWSYDDVAKALIDAGALLDSTDIIMADGYHLFQ